MDYIDVKISIDPLVIIDEIIKTPFNKFQFRSDNSVDYIEIKKYIMANFPLAYDIICDTSDHPGAITLLTEFIGIGKQISTIDIAGKNFYKLSEVETNKIKQKGEYVYRFLYMCYWWARNPLEIYNQIKEMIKNTIRQPIFKKIISDTKKYVNETKNDRNSKKDKIINITETIMRTKLHGSFEIDMVNGNDINQGQNLSRLLGKNKILFGHLDDFPNYTLVYFVHEILHSHFGFTKVEHAIIELIADNYLRMQLNKTNEYFIANNKRIGHFYLKELEEKMLPDWKKYIDSTETIYEFRDRMLEKYKD